MVFPVVMYRAESWTIKKAEHLRTDAFKLWCWRRLLRVPWTARKSNQSILKEINPEYSLEGLMLKMKLQYHDHLMQRADSMEKTDICWQRLKAGGEGDDREWDGWMASLTRWTWVWADSGRWWRTGKPGVLQSTGLWRVGHDWATEQQFIEPYRLKNGLKENQNPKLSIQFIPTALKLTCTKLSEVFTKNEDSWAPLGPYHKMLKSTEPTFNQYVGILDNHDTGTAPQQLMTHPVFRPMTVWSFLFPDCTAKPSPADILQPCWVSIFLRFTLNLSATYFLS